MQIRVALAVVAAALLFSSSATAQDVSFDIVRFQVEGNTLLPAERVQQLVSPFTGKKRVYGDVQKALEALEGAYRKAGYGTVQVFVPEQELAAGTVRLVVTESVIGKITVEGNKHFSAENIRNSLPGLQEGRAPNMRALSENVQLANENPAKQLDVTLGVAEEEGRVNAKVAVTDENPSRFVFTVDNTGTQATGHHRLGLAYQNANLFDKDHIFTFAANTSAERPSAVRVFSMAYRLPLYGIGDSIDIAYGNSTANVPVAQATGLNITGKGDVFAVRWNHYLPRSGEYTSKIVFGADTKKIESCVGAFCSPSLIVPVSVAYVGQMARAGELLDYNVSIAGGTGDLKTAALPAGFTKEFAVARFAASYLRLLPGDWTARLAMSGQHSARRLLDAEKFAVAGSTAVRGFDERVVAGDYGYVANIELTSPELVSYFGLPGSLKGVVFADAGQGYNYSCATAPSCSTQISGAGLGFRYALDKKLAFQLFATSANHNSGPINVPFRKNWGHFALQVTF